MSGAACSPTPMSRSSEPSRSASALSVPSATKRSVTPGAAAAVASAAAVARVRRDAVVDADREGALEVGDRHLGADQRRRLLQQRRRAGRCAARTGSGPFPAGADQDRVVHRPPQPAEGAAGRRDGQVQAVGRRRHAARPEQGVEHPQQVQIHSCILSNSDLSKLRGTTPVKPSLPSGPCTSQDRTGLLDVMCACVVLVVGMVAAINLAVPMLAASALHPSASALVWIVDTYVIVFACLVIPGGARRRPLRPQGRADGRARAVRRRRAAVGGGAGRRPAAAAGRSPGSGRPRCCPTRSPCCCTPYRRSKRPRRSPSGRR